jgi:hypothetical protein
VTDENRIHHQNRLPDLAEADGNQAASSTAVVTRTNQQRQPAFSGKMNHGFDQAVSWSARAGIVYIPQVSSRPGEGAATAAEAFLSTDPPDDAGASTADRYDWQAAMAAADGLGLYLDALDDGQLRDGEDARIVCEHHEDWAVVKAADAELVSAKHREPSNGVFTTLAQLADAGGLAHLFGRWHVLGELPACRLVTTAGLAPGPVQSLEKAAVFLRDRRLAGQELVTSGEHEQVIMGFARILQRHPDSLPDWWLSSEASRSPGPSPDQCAQISRFLSLLTIEHGKPSRRHVGHAAPSMYCEPVLNDLGLQGVSPVPAWEAVLGLFRVRMRARGPVPRGALPAVLSYQPGTRAPAGADERDLAARIVTVADIDVALRAAFAYPGGYRPLAPIARLTKIAVKMTAGGCADNSIERAEQLRLDYQRYWRAQISGDPAARAAQERLRRSLLHVSDQATTGVMATGAGTWGAALWQELQVRVDAMPAGSWPDDLDAELRLGGICDLAARCQVWFSPGFDVDAELARLRALGGTAS